MQWYAKLFGTGLGVPSALYRRIHLWVHCPIPYVGFEDLPENERYIQYTSWEKFQEVVDK